MNAYRYFNPVKTSPGVLTRIYMTFTPGIISIEVDIHFVYQLAFAVNVVFFFLCLNVQVPMCSCREMHSDVVMVVHA